MSSIINNINYNDFKNICRICMFNCEVKFPQDNIILDVFYKLTETHFETNIDLPQQICQKCFEKINEFHEFSLQSKRAHFILTNCLINYKNKRLNEKNKFVGDGKIKTRNDVVEEAVIKQEIIEETNEFNDDINSDTSEINYDQNDDDSDTSNVKMENDGESNQNNLNENIMQNDKNDSKHPYMCKQCFKSFIYLSGLIRHMRTHSSERPFKCDQCSKSFTQSNHLKVHRRIHSGERPFKCEYCSKSFTVPTNLKRHVRTHSGERPYKCNLCTKSYIEMHNLTVHMRTHNKKHPYK